MKHSKKRAIKMPVAYYATGIINRKTKGRIIFLNSENLKNICYKFNELYDAQLREFQSD